MKRKINKYVSLSVLTLIVMVIGYIASIQKSSTDGAIIKVDKSGFFDTDYTGYYIHNTAVGGDDIYRIYVTDSSGNPDRSNAGWCLKHHAYLYGYGQGMTPYSVIQSSGDAQGYSGIPDYILYNLVRNGDSVDEEEKEFYKTRLGLNGNDDDTVFIGEQRLIWTYTNSESTSNAVASRIQEVADANSSYTKSMDNNISLSKKDDSKCDSTNNTFGLFTASNEGNLYVKYNIRISKDGSDFAQVSDYTAYTVDGAEIGDLSTYNGDFYIKVNEENSSSATLEIEQVHYNTEARYYETQESHQPLLYIDRTKVSIVVGADTEIIKTGSFDIKLIKYEEGTDGKKLAGAEFKVEIPELGYSDTKTTGDNGEASFNVATIKGENQEYTVKVTETTPPPGYIGIEGTKEFKVTTQLVDETKYKLVPKNDIVVDNLKSVKVEENQILIEAENRTTSIDIHKGVKTVENQDSGYYAVAEKIKEAEEKQAKEDAERETEYEDETTGKKYTEVELEDMQHEWVVETTIPEGISNYKRYLVNDPIDTTKLNFSGLGRVKVELIDSTGKVVKTLAKDKDYTTKYENDILTVTYIDRKDGNDFYGEFLSEATTSNKIRLTFNTTFKVNPETGKLVVLEGTITNAENQAKLKYDNGSGTDQDDESEKPEVHTGAVSVFKYEDTNNNGKHDEGEKALVGAEFKIAISEEDAKNGKFVKMDGKELVAISNKDGIATFIGLEFGGDASDSQKSNPEGLYKYDWDKASKDYYIVETKSPGGYKKLDDVIKVTVSKNSSEIIDLTDKINEMESVANLPLKFDLALRKWVTHAIVTENGQSVVYETGHHAEDNPEAIVKVDLKKSKLNQVKVQFKYSIRVTNEGEIAGEAREVTDYIPEGLKFVQEDNPDWTTTSDERIVKTRKLEGVTLQPGESAEVEIMLTWVNSKDSMGVMTNTAEISEDYNEFGVHDIDSTPNNKKAGEDDIDDAPVMLAIKTGSEVIAYTSLGLGFVTVVTIGAIAIRRKFANI